MSNWGGEISILTISSDTLARSSWTTWVRPRIPFLLLTIFGRSRTQWAFTHRPLVLWSAWIWLTTCGRRMEIGSRVWSLWFNRLWRRSWRRTLLVTFFASVSARVCSFTPQSLRNPTSTAKTIPSCSQIKSSVCRIWRSFNLPRSQLFRVRWWYQCLSGHDVCYLVLCAAIGIDLVIDTRRLKETWPRSPSVRCYRSTFASHNWYIPNRWRDFHFQPSLWSTFPEDHPYQCLGWSEASRPIGKMEDCWRSRCVGPFPSCWRTAETSHCDPKGHVGYVLKCNSEAFRTDRFV